MLRAAFRSLRSTPLVSVTAVLSLAFGIGGTAAIFSILNGLLLKPLPVPHPDELVALIAPNMAGEPAGISYPAWMALRDRRVMPPAFVTAGDRLSMKQGSLALDVNAVWASGEMFEVLRLPVALGRPLTAADDERGGGAGGPVAVISQAFWQRVFGGDSAVLSRTITLDGTPVRIVGVTPEAFHGLTVGESFDVILPLQAGALMGRLPRLESPTWTGLQVIARRRPAETITALSAAVRQVQPQIRAALMPQYERDEDRAQFMPGTWHVEAAPGGTSRLRRQYGQALVVLLAFVACVLLAACANIAGLLLARGRARQLEFSVRRSLGASGRQLLAQQLAETLLLSLAGGAVGVLLAVDGSRALVGQLSTWAFVVTLDLSPDWRVIGIAVGATLATAVLCGIVPALSAMRAQPVEAMRSAVRGASRRQRALSGFVLAQVAVSTLLVVGAGLFLRSFTALAYRDIGLDRDRVLIAVLDAGQSAVPAPQRADLFERARAAVAALPGVEAAAVSMATPIGNAGVRLTPAITVPGMLPAAGIRILTNPVSPDWFRAYGTRLVAGRDFDDHDRPGTTPVVIVNQAFAATYLTGHPIGQTITDVSATGQRTPLQIVGVVENAAFTSVRDPIAPTLYAPLAQRVGPDMAARFGVSLSIRARGPSPASLEPAVVAALRRVDPGTSVTVRTVREQVDYFYTRERLLAMLSVFFGGFAVLLAVTGLYALMVQTITWRRAEIGIRLALGALPASVRRLLLRELAAIVAAGLAVGLALSAWASGLLASLLFQVTAHDALAFAGAAAIIAAVATGAGWWPVLRASRMNPSVVLRDL